LPLLAFQQTDNSKTFSTIFRLQLRVIPAATTNITRDVHCTKQSKTVAECEQ